MTGQCCSARELSARWGVSIRTLQRWRARNSGPAWLRLCGRVVYRIEDVRAFEAAHLRGPVD